MTVNPYGTMIQLKNTANGLLIQRDVLYLLRIQHLCASKHSLKDELRIQHMHAFKFSLRKAG